MTGTLIEILDRLDQVDDSDDFDPPLIYAERGSNALATARACICPGGDGDDSNCPLDSSLSYVLMVQQAKNAIEVWSEWRDDREPTPEEKFAAVMYYSQHDAYLPIEDE